MSEPSAKNEVSSSSKIHKPTDGSQTTLSQDTSTTSDVSNDLVSTAAKFLKNPKIAPSPLAQKRAFLKSKGLTEEQIEMACLQAGISSNEENVVSSPSPSSSPVVMKNYPLISSPNPQNSWLTKLRDLANLVLVLGGAAYGLHFLWQNFIHPWLKNKLKDKEEEENNQLQKTLDSLAASMTSLEATMSSQKVVLEMLVQKTESLSVDDYSWKKENNDIKSEIISLKGLLLSTSRFPENPPVSFAIPDWQLKSGEAPKESKETNNNEQKVEIVTNGLNSTKESKPEPEKHDQQVLDPDLLSQID